MNKLFLVKMIFFENIQDDYKISYIIPNAQKNEMEPILIELKKGKKSMEIDPHDGEELDMLFMENYINEW